MDDPRQALERAAGDAGTSLAALSRLIGRNAAYLQQYVRRGSPRVLPERERAMLAAFLGIAEELLGGPAAGDAMVAVPHLDLAAAAGAGRLTGEERVRRDVSLSRAMLRSLGIEPGAASVIDVAGDSMAPTLLDGDRVLVDAGDRRVTRGGVFVVRVDDLIAIKRVARSGEGWKLASDNPAFPPRRVQTDALSVIGRARLLLRGL